MEKMNQTSITDYFKSPVSTKLKLSTTNISESSLLAKQASSLVSPKNSQPRPRKRRIHVDEDSTQMMLDAGQKSIGLKQCKECGMVYSVDTAKDVGMHKDYHNRAVETKFFRVTPHQLKTWKSQMYSEEVAAKFNGILFRFNEQTKSTLKGKMEGIVQDIINVELGFCNDIPIWDTSGKRSALVFVLDSPNSNIDKDNSPFVASIVLTEPVEKVYLMPMNREFRGKFIGINRIWVHKRMRKRGLARMMLDLTRRLFSDSSVDMLPKTRIAFSEPTEDGEKLAIKYLDDKENRRFISYGL